MKEYTDQRYGHDPDRDAWLTNFFTENHLAFEAFPDIVASPEQLNFMVYMEGDTSYYPCSDELFTTIIEKRADRLLNSAYINIWSKIEELVRSVIKNEYRQQYLLNLLTIKYTHETASRVLLPSRLEKRLLRIFTNISEIERPLSSIREQHSRRAYDFVQSEVFHETINSPQGLKLDPEISLDKIDQQINLLRLQRLLLLSTMKEVWENDEPPDSKTVHEVAGRSINSEGWHWLCQRLREVMTGKASPYVLWIGGKSGEIIFDLAIIDILIKMGIKVILTVKQAFFYDRISLVDLLEDPVLDEIFRDAFIIPDLKISKNKLLRRLRSDKKLFVISDGTIEKFNPLLTSVTYARAFKEVDLVINRCMDSEECMNNHFQFTRDLISVTGEEKGIVNLTLRKRHPDVVHFLEQDLRHKAETLIYMVKKERERGNTIMFYSAIVGSIPGQLELAKKILNVLVDYLRSTMENAVIINPGEHYEEGMDADDLMYMWEIFQRSGLIDIWRFQTVQDVEKAFSLMDEKVPPEWTGKDATYSTGCTKEMEIAIKMQKKFPEMQIIGPSWERFLRRREYGVGKLYDRTLS